jgi:septal ring factor EnvC (AmiA/AmiB activator)/SH3-like domain-containing protein
MPSFVKTILKCALTGIIVQSLTIFCLQAEEAKQLEGVVSAAMLNIRSGPGQEYPSTRQLTQGNRVSILKMAGEGEWIKIKFQGETGFIRNRESYIHIRKSPSKPSPREAPPKPSPPAPRVTTLKSAKESGVIASDWLHVRSGPGTTYPSIVLLKQGAKVDILKEMDGWLHIAFEGGTGFIRNRETYITLPTKSKKTAHQEAKPSPVQQPSAVPEREREREPLAKKPEPAPALSVSPPPNKVTVPIPPQEAARSRVEQITQKIEYRQQEAKQYTEKEQSIISGLDEIEVSLNILFQGAAAIRKNLTEIETKVADAEKQLNDLTAAMAADEEYIAKRIVSLYKLSNIGNMPILASSDSMYEFFTRKTAMDRIIEEDARVFENYDKNRDRLVALKKDLESQQANMVSLTSDYDEKIRIISNQKEKRSKLLGDIRRQKNLTMAAIAMLRETQADLEQKIQSSYRRETSRPTEEKGAGPACVFTQGGMTPPVNGQVVSLFGQGMAAGYHFKTLYNGIDIKTERGEPIQALCGGKTIFSEWLRGYGNLIIIDHGNDYYTVYAHAEELFKKKGDPVETGEVIGTVGESGSTLEPKLYFEIRHHGKPIDPLTWLKKG